MPKRNTTALLALAGVIVFWSGAPIVLKYFTGVLDAWTVNGLRYVFTALFWLPVVAREHRLARDPALWRAAWLPALCHMLGQAGWGLAPYYNDASVMNFVSRLGFLLTAVVGFIFLRSERALARTPLFWLGAAGSVAGLLVLFRGGSGVGSTSPLGMGILIWTSLFWSLYAVHVRLRMARYPARLAGHRPGTRALLQGRTRAGPYCMRRHAGPGALPHRLAGPPHPRRANGPRPMARRLPPRHRNPPPPRLQKEDRGRVLTFDK